MLPRAPDEELRLLWPRFLSPTFLPFPALTSTLFFIFPPHAPSFLFLRKVTVSCSVESPCFSQNKTLQLHLSQEGLNISETVAPFGDSEKILE